MAAPAAIGVSAFEPAACGAEPAALVWARSGAMALCGHAGGAPRAGAAAVAAAADAMLRGIRALAADSAHLPADGAALLGERAALLGLARRGRVSAGGACRLLRAADGWLALSLARPEDVALLPAWLACDLAGGGADPWPRLEAAVRERSAAELVARGRLMGMALAESVAPEGVPVPGDPGVRAQARGPGVRVQAFGTPRGRVVGWPLVVDLSSLWAGPLCTHLLAGAGARVVKVESTARPDGARRGNAAFFDLLNAGKESVALDLGSAPGRDALRRLLARADVVVEASRPRALRQLGIEAEALVAERPGLTWISLTGHGRAEPGAGWIAFGDDAAVAAGLAVASGGADDPVFCADAVADPLAGLAAAHAALRALAAGGGVLVDVPLAGVAREALGAWPAPGPEARVLRAGDGWLVECEGARERVAAPRARRPAGRARPLGSDTEAVLRELSC